MNMGVASAPAASLQPPSIVHSDVPFTLPSHQESYWNSKVGCRYTDKHCLSPRQLDNLGHATIGHPRAKLLLEMVQMTGLTRWASILEVGCNVGNNLAVLDEAGYTSLWGIDFQEYAVRLARERLAKANVFCAPAQRVPLPSGHYDLVLTSGLLIHIPPAELPQVMGEVVRLSRRYVLGYERWAPVLREVKERVTWEGPYSAIYQNDYGMRLVWRERFLHLRHPGEEHHMFLMEKGA